MRKQYNKDAEGENNLAGFWGWGIKEDFHLTNELIGAFPIYTDV